MSRRKRKKKIKKILQRFQGYLFAAVACRITALALEKAHANRKPTFASGGITAVPSPNKNLLSKEQTEALLKEVIRPGEKLQDSDVKIIVSCPSSIGGAE